MISVRNLLKNKGGEVWHVSPRSTAFEALELMAEKDIGAVLVIEDGRLVGIFSERDYARKVILKGKSSKVALVGELMTPSPYCVSPEMTISECMAMMTTKKFRHLPVVDEGRLVGLITIGDVVKAFVGQQETTIHDLENFITGAQYDTRCTATL